MATDNRVNLQVTLWPAFDHFSRFAMDHRVQGIRLNSAMMAAAEIDSDFVRKSKVAKVPLWFDIKGMQLRIREIVCDESCDHLEFILNRPIKCNVPCPVWFKGGEDCAKLIEIKNGTHLIFEGGPHNTVKVGESLHIRNPELEVGGPTFLDYEIEKIQRVVNLGFNRYYLSYVYSQKHVDEFREFIGPDAELYLKIENKLGLNYIADEFKPSSNTHLTAALGDLFVEVDRPHQILQAVKLVIEKDPAAVVGSRMLLSMCNDKAEPSCADLTQLAWFYDIGFRNFLLCDELCLKESWLGSAIRVFESVRDTYFKVK
jgi:pyruvate kinase